MYQCKFVYVNNALRVSCKRGFVELVHTKNDVNGLERASRKGGYARWHILLDLNRSICTIERHRERGERGK